VAHDIHSLVQALKELAAELGETPTRAQFEQKVVGAHSALAKLGGYCVILQAAGLESVGTNKNRNITNAVFERSLERHLEAHEPRKLKPRTAWPKIAVLGDMHEPFAHTKCKQAFIAFCKEMQPEYVVQIGDAVDFFGHSKWPASKNIYKPKEEEAIARANLEKFWAEIRKAVPKAKCIMLLGNHAVRPLKRILETTPSLEHWIEQYLESYLKFEGVETVMDTREEYTLSDVVFIHGYKSQLGQHRDHLLQNTVCGHTHRGGVSFRSFRAQTMFELNVGHCSDEAAKAMTYTPTKTTGWTLGWGWIDRWGPRFIPFC